MRCWRIMSVSGRDKNVLNTSSSSSQSSELELSFEYLMHSGELQWITVVSSQAILMSLCLQSMVEELLREKAGVKVKEVRILLCL